MFYPQNLHTHSTFCDGKDDCESTVLKAMEIGFTAIGFSGHSHTDYIAKSSSMSVANTALYKKEIARLKKKYEGQIEVLCGLEFDQYSDDDRQGYDYIIGTNHYLKVDGTFIGFDTSAEEVQKTIDDYFSGDGLRFAKEYYRQFAELPQYGKFDIVGHFDLVSKNCEKVRLFDETDERYQKYALDCFYALKEKISVFEVNTGAVARGYRTTPYPHSFLLREMAKTGVGITISSDCHDNTLLAYGFDQAVEYCKACGIKELQIFTRGEFKGLPLV